MGGTGKVVTNAGLVFAFTMMAMAVSELRIIAQVGTTIGLGLLFDTLIVRSFMTPSIAALLGRWFWWPQIVRPRPASALLQPVAPRPVARVLLLREQDAATSRRRATHDDDTQPLDLVGNGHHRRVQLSEYFAGAHRQLGADDGRT
jgi:RND superfamily putative drug exporter